MRDHCWQIGNLNWEWLSKNPPRQERALNLDHPWQVVSPDWDFKYFATHAEAITYADKQARRTA